MMPGSALSIVYLGDAGNNNPSEDAGSSPRSRLKQLHVNGGTNNSSYPFIRSFIGVISYI